jgi:NAD-dependent deacetylase
MARPHISAIQILPFWWCRATPGPCPVVFRSQNACPTKQSNEYLSGFAKATRSDLAVLGTLKLMQAVREWLHEARSVAVLTGAGVSAESGVPTFRGNGGLWKQHRTEDLATPGVFARDPKRVWEWYDWRRGLIAETKPNPGHLALAELEKRTGKFTLITQNVDGLHEHAGSKNVLRLHGSIWALRCIECERVREDRRSPLPEIPPMCECGGMLRPGVVWFGEALPAKVWRDAEAAATTADLFLVIGTSAVVYPAAGLAQLAKSSGARVVVINIAETALSENIDSFLQGPSGELLPRLIA